MTTPPHPDVGRIATDPDAFEDFYREHLATVQRLVARRVADPHLAADLTAEVFLAAVDCAAQYRPERGVPAAWLAGVARNVVSAEFRRQSRDPRPAAPSRPRSRLMSLDTFEQSLLGELRRHVATRNTRLRTGRRTLALVAGGVAATGVTAVALAVGTSVAGPTAAFAVEAQPDGDVVVTVHDLSDASALEHALAAKGVDADVRYDPGFTQSQGSARHAGAPGAACDIALTKVDGGLRFTLGAAQIASGARLDVVTSGSSPSDVGSPVAVTWSGGAC